MNFAIDNAWRLPSLLRSLIPAGSEPRRASRSIQGGRAGVFERAPYPENALEITSKWFTSREGSLRHLKPDTSKGAAVQALADSVLIGPAAKQFEFIEMQFDYERAVHTNHVLSQGREHRLICIPPRWIQRRESSGTVVFAKGVRAKLTFTIADAALLMRRFGADIDVINGPELRRRAACALEQAGFPEPNESTVDGVAAALFALGQFPDRMLNADSVRSFFDGALRARPDTSIVEAAVLSVLGAEGELELFSEKVKRLVFDPSAETGPVGQRGLARSVAWGNQQWLNRFGVKPDSDAFMAACRFLLDDAKWLSTTVAGTGPLNTVSRNAEQAEQNYERAVDYVVDVARSGCGPRFSDIFVLNKILLGNVPLRGQEPGHAGGKVRDFQIYAGHFFDRDLKQYPEVHHLQELTETIERWFTEELRRTRAGEVTPEQLASAVVRRLLSIHPFSDANGRTARLMGALCLMTLGRPPPLMLHHQENMPTAYASRVRSPTELDYFDVYARAVRRGVQMAAILAGSDPFTAYRAADATVKHKVPSTLVQRFSPHPLDNESC